MTGLLGEAPAGFSHETFLYRGDADFLAGLLPFVREGLERDEAVVVAEPRPRLDQLRDALGEDARSVQLLDMGDVGANPGRIIAVWEAAVQQHLDSGRGLRGVGEPAHPGRRPVELVECQIHELLLNRAFDDGPGWRLLCPYDAENLPAEVCAGAMAAHPVRYAADERVATGGYTAAEGPALLAEALPPPSGATLRGRYRAGEVSVVRRTVAQFGRTCGLRAEQVEVLELAASELVTNSIRHGGGSGNVAMWLEPDAAVVEFSDRGRIADPLVGRHAPRPDRVGGHGVFLVHQLCDLVQVRSTADGTTVRVTTWR